MKRSGILLIIALTVVGYSGFTQTITFSKENITLKDLFKVIKQQTGYTHLVTESLLLQAKPFSINANNTPLHDVLDMAFKDQPLNYEIVEKTILVKKKTGSGTSLPPPVTSTLIGRILNEKDEPVAGATIEVKGVNALAVANDNGEFTITGIQEGATVIITHVNYQAREIIVQDFSALTVRLQNIIADLPNVTVVHTGYEKTSKVEMTGSSYTINEDLFNRRVSTNILERLDGITSGLIFNKNIVEGTNQSTISIRGRSTIFANPEPLIILDNFPYTGDISSINPNDIETVSILKDAAATAIWGTLSGNGVIVITTKTGKYNQPVQVSLNSNITVGNKPDLFYEPVLNSSDYIDVEKFLFENNHYSSLENNPQHPVLSPVIEILIQERNGDISEPEARQKINSLRSKDIRKEREKYFYCKSINQQYSISASGGGPGYSYYFSGGFDKNLPAVKRGEYQRKTFTVNNTLAIIKNKLELNAGIIYTESNAINIVSGDIAAYYPYIQLADANGIALSVPYGQRQPYRDTAGQGKLLDWNYRPLDEFNLANNKLGRKDTRINIGLNYTIIPGLRAGIIYQHTNANTENQNFYSVESYFTRNLINQFTQIDASGITTRPVPLGDIIDQGNSVTEANNIRGQINYKHTWQQKHTLTAIAGTELRNITGTLKGNRLYGYDETRPTGALIDYQTSFPLFQQSPSVLKIPFYAINRKTTDRYISYYLNAVYSYSNKYMVSVSGRKDESNLFGVNANQKGVPLWSAGVAWTISNESFYHLQQLPYLKLRVTSGYNGNVDKSVSAYTTAVISDPNIYGAILGYIINPPNPSLRWEKNYMVNIGLDFGFPNKRVEGSFEFYYKKGIDLIGNSPIDPTTGNTQLRGNTANTKGKGFDFTLNTINSNRQVKWFSTALLSYATDKVTEYKVKKSSIETYFEPSIINPLVGKPLYSVYSLQWKGLDPLTGDPQGVLDKQVSKNYTQIYYSTNFDDLIYNGPANPTVFGSIRNTFNWKQLELSFNITFKAGYYFKSPSINYFRLFTRESKGHPDYEERWKNPGDEVKTTIPSLKYPADRFRDQFYNNTEILVEKGDHIRLQDIRLSFDINKQLIPKLPVKTIRVYLYANNIGLIWKANNKGIDPDYIYGIPNPFTLSTGIKVDF